MLVPLLETYMNNIENWTYIYIFTLFIYLSIYNSAALIYFKMLVEGNVTESLHKPH